MRQCLRQSRRTPRLLAHAYPEIPSDHATLDDCSRVAAHVHCETMTEPVRPILMLRPPVLYDSDVLCRPDDL